MKTCIVYLSIIALALLMGCTDTPNTGSLITDATTNVQDGGLLLGKGQPPPPPPPTLPLDLSSGHHIAAATMGGSHGGLHVWRYNSGGTLTSTWSKTSSTNTYWGVGIGDIDHDGASELVAVSRFVSSKRGVPSTLDLEVYKQNSTGDPSATYSLLPQAYTSSWDIAVSDADNDGYPEILVGGRSSLQVWKWNLNKNILEKSWETIFPDSWNEFPRTVEINDADNDGDYDLLYSSMSRKIFNVYPRIGLTWVDATSSPTMSSGVIEVKVGDVDNGRLPGLPHNEVVCGKLDGTIEIFRYVSGQYVSTYTSPNLGGFPDGLAIGDFNKDTKNEIAVGVQTGSNTSGKDFIIYSYDPISKSYAETYSKVLGVIFNVFTSADCDGDGFPELFAGGGTGGTRNVTVFQYAGGTYQTNFYSTPDEVMDLDVK
jgi:hypothetical protein